MKITKGKLKKIIMEEISYLEQDMINVPELMSMSPEALNQNVVAMLQELSEDISGGDYERVYSIITNENQMNKLVTKVKALMDHSDKSRGPG